MKLLKKGILFYLTIMLVSIIVQGCCENKIEIVGNGDMYIAQIDNNRSDTIRDQFSLDLILEVEYGYNMLNDLAIINSSYATSCDETYVNEMDQATLQLTCDKNLTYDGELFEANTNLSSINELVIRYQDYEGSINIQFLSDFLEKAEFDTGDHEFEISIETEDGMKFTNKVSTYLEI